MTRSDVQAQRRAKELLSNCPELKKKNKKQKPTLCVNLEKKHF